MTPLTLNLKLILANNLNYFVLNLERCVCVHLQPRDSSRNRRREKEDIKITKERTPASEEEPTEWETNREGSVAPFVQV